MEHGIHDTTLNWLVSYLSDRREITTIQSSTSQPSTIKCGVLQGSILGPLLFLLYISDLPNCNLVGKTRLYADDTSLTFSSKNMAETQTLLNEDLEKVNTWLQVNKRTLNGTKTKNMLIGTHHKIASIIREPSIVVNDEPIERVQKYNCLGITLDETLSWDQHIEEISLKVSRGLGALKRIRSYVLRSTLITIFNTIILPYFDYCSTVWGSIGICQSDNLQRLQNRAARIITRSTYKSGSVGIFRSLKLWHNLEQRKEKQLAIMMYKVTNGLIPCYLQSCFT